MHPFLEKFLAETYDVQLTILQHRYGGSFVAGICKRDDSDFVQSVDNYNGERDREGYGLAGSSWFPFVYADSIAEALDKIEQRMKAIGTDNSRMLSTLLEWIFNEGDTGRVMVELSLEQMVTFYYLWEEGEVNESVLFVTCPGSVTAEEVLTPRPKPTPMEGTLFTKDQPILDNVPEPDYSNEEPLEWIFTVDDTAGFREAMIEWVERVNSRVKPTEIIVYRQAGDHSAELDIKTQVGRLHSPKYDKVTRQISFDILRTVTDHIQPRLWLRFIEVSDPLTIQPILELDENGVSRVHGFALME